MFGLTTYGSQVPKGSRTVWEDQIKLCAMECSATIGEVNSGARSYTFLEVDFGRESKSLALSHKCIGKFQDIRSLRMTPRNLIMREEAKAVRLALMAFMGIFSSHLQVFVDNTSLQVSETKGSATPYV
ncbi:hypothetical protein LSM04_006162 [Trypanosoma melophagium]|uniref:uncharacterized protein n=1 Tax=Trypanosoma melophagium TaxID=715481 RepID=UPI00351A7C23|nr:hypothetical protein LSM04_006162 [Trypanosoma melophagium]